MDAMAHALKKKIGGVHITVEPIKDEEHLMGQDPKLDIDTDLDKENMDMAPDVKSHDNEMDRLHKMIGPDMSGDPMRKPMTLDERAKSKMKERMASIKKEKGLKGKY